RFGLDCGEQRTLEAVAKELDMSREQVRQIERSALRALRRSHTHRCTFCSASLPEAQRLFKGQPADICLHCLRNATQFFRPEQRDPTQDNHLCYFCDAKQSEAGHLYLSEHANICPSCVHKYLQQS